MKRTLVIILAAFALSCLHQSAAAQETGVPVMTVHTAQTARAAYRSALGVLLEGGLRPETRLLDESLITAPAETRVRIDIGRERDSTTVRVMTVALMPDLLERCMSERCQQRELAVARVIAERVQAAVEALPRARRTMGDSLASAGAYGYAPSNAILVGGGRESGVQNEHAFIESLAGPGGEPVSYLRLGSCCRFQTPNGLTDGMGMLDAYEVSYPGQDDPVVLYINLYDPPRDAARIPPGFKRQEPPTGAPPPPQPASE